MAALLLTLHLEMAGGSSEAECASGGTGMGPGPQARLCLEQVPVPLATVPVLFWESVTSRSPFSSHINLVFSTRSWSGFAALFPYSPRGILFTSETLGNKAFNQVGTIISSASLCYQRNSGKEAG